MLREDYVERLIAQVAEAIGRVLGLAQSGRQVEAQGELDAMWSRAAGLRRRDVERLDETTLRSLLGSKRAVAAMLLEAEAQVMRSQGESAAADPLLALAAKLRR